ncbi:MAG: MTH938/NDUFAF3 family protein [Patescibacteria group bacterium]
MRVKYISPTKIEIADQEYKETILVSSEGVIFSWQEKKMIEKEDLIRFIKEAPDLLVIGTNKNVKSVSVDGQKFLKEKGIILVVDKLFEAVNVFNKATKSDKKILALFPLG